MTDLFAAAAPAPAPVPAITHAHKVMVDCMGFLLTNIDSQNPNCEMVLAVLGEVLPACNRIGTPLVDDLTGAARRIFQAAPAAFTREGAGEWLLAQLAGEGPFQRWCLWRVGIALDAYRASRNQGGKDVSA